MRDDDLMDPKASPSRVKARVGVRRLNGRPLILLLLVLAGFLAVMAKTAIDRKERQVLANRGNEDQGGDSTMFAQAVTGAARPGYLAATLPPPPVVPVTKEELEIPPPPPALVPRAGPPQVVSRDTDGERIRQLKFAAMLSAARAPTAGFGAAAGIGNGLEGGTTPVASQAPAFGARPAAGNPALVADSLARARREAQAMREAARSSNPVSGPSVGRGTGRISSTPVPDLPGAGAQADPVRLAGGEGFVDVPSSAADSRADAHAEMRADIDRWDNSAPARDRWRLRAQPQAPRSAFEIRAGTVLPAVLITGINSDLAGPILAQVSQSVFDTPTGRHLLIPQGTKLFGRYANEIAFGQSRVLIAWQRLTFPDGTALDIGAMPGVDEAGQAGFADRVNHHYLRLFGNALLLSAITGGIALSQRDGGGASGGINARQSAGDVMSQQLGVVLGQTIAAVIRRNLNISPTIEIRPGYRFNVITTRDITLDAPYQAFGYVTGAAR